ncbi:MAG TPA: hypothetical protein VHA33_19585 [Candidatus Angelobacter sp.]|jgi:hypothetical protein|nr:hypothetical protein [Candidatus Angelobacter sp.]
MIQPQKQVLVKWRSLVSEQDSGQSVAVFCRARELPKLQFYYWKKRVREGAAPQFVEVRVAKPHLSQKDCGSTLGPTIEVRLSNGRSLGVAPGFDASHLRALLAVAESEPC